MNIFPETAIDALLRWDQGDPVFTIEMGGLGPGYEQCIHVGVFELIRKLGLEIDQFPTEEDRLNDFLDGALLSIQKVKDLGLSGAQAGAIKSLAHAYMTKGYRHTIESVDTDRKIQVSKTFP